MPRTTTPPSAPLGESSGPPSLSSGSKSSTIKSNDLWALRREIARSNAAYLGDQILDLHPTDFHVEWQRLCSDHRRLILFGPIEHGKTQQLSVLRPIWELGQNPNLRIALISETSTQSVKWLSRIKANIESNARLRAIYPRLQPAIRRNRFEHWHENSILVQRDRYFSLREKDFSIEALGVGGAIMGSRFDIAILDDTVTRRNGLTAAGRENIYDWLKEVLLGRITEDGSVWITNNAWHIDDMPHRLERDEPGVWTSRRYAAGEANCRWPERWSEERLRAKREELGDVEFARQLQNMALSDSTGLLPYESARDCQRLCQDPDAWWSGDYPQDQFRWVTAGLDLGASETKGSNLTAIAVAGDHRAGTKHLLHMRSGQWMGKALLEQIVQVQRSMKPREWLVETNAAQAHIASLAADPALLQAVGATPEEARSIRVFGQYTGAAAKRGEEHWAIRGMGKDLDARRWRFPRRREVEELIGDIRRYSLVDHTGDRLIALWLADCRLKGLGSAIHFQATSR